MRKMDCRERVLAALNIEEPDRVPSHTILIDANNVDIILGKPQISDFDTVEQIQRDNPDGWMEELSNLVEKRRNKRFFPLCGSRRGNWA